jgi:predicted amidohydrolase YtcJ
MNLVLSQMPQPTFEEDVELLALADKKLASYGVVAATDAWIDPGMAEVYFEASARGTLSLNYELFIRVSPEEQIDQFEYLERMLNIALEREAAVPPNQVAIKGIKIFLDGVISSRTAWLSQPYLDGSHGNQIWSDEALEMLLERLARVSPELRPHFHAIGDAAVSQAVRVIDRARRRGIWRATIAQQSPMPS